MIAIAASVVHSQRTDAASSSPSPSAPLVLTQHDGASRHGPALLCTVRYSILILKHNPSSAISLVCGTHTTAIIARQQRVIRHLPDRLPRRQRPARPHTPYTSTCCRRGGGAAAFGGYSVHSASFGTCRTAHPDGSAPPAHTHRTRVRVVVAVAARPLLAAAPCTPCAAPGKSRPLAPFVQIRHRGAAADTRLQRQVRPNPTACLPLSAPASAVDVARHAARLRSPRRRGSRLLHCTLTHPPYRRQRRSHLTRRPQPRWLSSFRAVCPRPRARIAPPPPPYHGYAPT